MYFTITKQSGIKLNVQKTDFNTSANHFAKFSTKEKAETWGKENNHRFKAIITGLPVKLTVNEHK